MTRTVSPYSDVKLSASTSLTEAEVALLDAVLRGIQAGADLRIIARRPAVASLARKLPAMRAQIERNKARRVELARGRAERVG